jgi:hypothetical protein
MTKKDAAKDDAAKPESARPLGGKILNAPTVTNTGGYELKVALAKPEAIKMAGHNNGGFENRVIQEQGTHLSV